MSYNPLMENSGSEEATMTKLVQYLREAQETGARWEKGLNPQYITLAVGEAFVLCRKYGWDVSRVSRYSEEYIRNPNLREELATGVQYMLRVTQQYYPDILLSGERELRNRRQAVQTQTPAVAPIQTVQPVIQQAGRPKGAWLWLLPIIVQLAVSGWLTSVGSWHLAGLAGLVTAMCLWLPFFIMGSYRKGLGKYVQRSLAAIMVIFVAWVAADVTYSIAASIQWAAGVGVGILIFSSLVIQARSRRQK